jgi:hypothetical protein
LSLSREIAQEFPGIVSSLTRQKVAKNLRKEVKSNQQAVGSGGGYLMLNGLLVEINNFELYSKCGLAACSSSLDHSSIPGAFHNCSLSLLGTLFCPCTTGLHNWAHAVSYAVNIAVYHALHAIHASTRPALACRLLL